jgi:predicted permease
VVNGENILLISFLASITPSAATVMQLAKIYEKDADFAAAINIVTTIVCIVTMPLFVAIYNMI